MIENRGQSPNTPSLKPKRLWLFGLRLAGLLVVLYGGYLWGITPHVNPNPTKKVVVRGVFPYDRGWELEMRQDFYTRNSICKQTARVFFFIPVADVSRERNLPITVKREGKDQYVFEYYEDYFFPGFCEWSPGFVVYRIRADQDPIDRHGGALLGFPRQFNKINYECHSRKIPVNSVHAKFEIASSCYEGDNRSFDSTKVVSEVNFVWKGEAK